MVMENRKIQHRKKMAAPIIIAVLLILWYIGMAIACFCIPEIPFIFKILMAIIPAAIQKYVTTNYPDAKILKIERDKKDYEVKLSNRTELKFDLKFNLIDIDF